MVGRAGRPRVSPADRTRGVTVSMTPAQLERLDTIAEVEVKSRSEIVLDALYTLTRNRIFRRNP